MKKIVLGISASPRKDGNTAILVMHLLKFLESKAIQTEYLSFSELKVNPCIGCGYCAKKKKCKIDDDCEKIFNSMKRADFIIIGSPVYRLGVPAQLKALIDRSSFLIQRNELFSGKESSIIVIGREGSTGKIQTANTIVDFLLSMDCSIVPPIILGNAHKKGEIKKDSFALLLIEQLGKKIRKISMR